MGLMTIASLFTTRFNKKAGLLASLCTIPAYVGWVASLMVAFGRILQSLTGIDPSTGIPIAAAIALLTPLLVACGPSRLQTLFR